MELKISFRYSLIYQLSKNLGLVNNNQSQTINKFPLLGDMPILGPLFRSNQFQNNQSELVIIITPYIVRPTGDHQLALPTDGFSPPSQADRLLRMRYNSSDATTRTLSGEPLAAPAAAASEPVSTETLPVQPDHSAESPETTAPNLKPISLNPTRQPPAKNNLSGSSPAGPGGFVVE